MRNLGFQQWTMQKRDTVAPSKKKGHAQSRENPLDLHEVCEGCSEQESPPILCSRDNIRIPIVLSRIVSGIGPVVGL